MATTQILDGLATDYRLHVKAPRYSLIVSSVPWWPGGKWSATAPASSPSASTAASSAFTVPPGDLDVRVWYDPWTFRFGAIIALATVAGLIGIGVKLRSDTP